MNSRLFNELLFSKHHPQRKTCLNCLLKLRNGPTTEHLCMFVSVCFHFDYMTEVEGDDMAKWTAGQHTHTATKKFQSQSCYKITLRSWKQKAALGLFACAWAHVCVFNDSLNQTHQNSACN